MMLQLCVVKPISAAWKAVSAETALLLSKRRFEAGSYKNLSHDGGCLFTPSLLGRLRLRDQALFGHGRLVGGEL